MPYNELHADRIRQRLTAVDFVEKKMMGGLIFMVRGAMCVGLDVEKATRSDRLMVRVGTLEYDTLLTKPGGRAMDFTGTPMRGFLFIGAEGFDLDNDLDFWIEKALEFNRLLTH